jgi:hypothetical protein
MSSSAVLERFWSKVVVRPSGCWEWQGSLISQGYGSFGIGPTGRGVRVHRFAYELLRERIPDGLTLDHLCRNRACCNPNHLEPVTNTENVLRGVGLTAQNARKTHCMRGHEFTPENTTHFQNRRRCRVCLRQAQYAYMRRKRGKAA